MNFMLRNPRLRAASVLALLAWWAAACAVGPNYQRPATTPPGTFQQAGALPTSTNAVDQAWWRLFGDPVLVRLIHQAETNNLDLRLATARLREARYLWREARFDLAPTVRSENYYQNSQASAAVSPPGLTDRQRQGELYRIGFDATWELDLWGRVRRSVEAARATVEAVDASARDVLVTVRAEVAANYLELRGLEAQLEVAGRNATNQAETLKLAVVLRDGGQGTQLDVARSRSLWNATLATIPPLEADRARVAHRLAVLTGRMPGEIDAELADSTGLPSPGGTIDLGDPTELLRRRPDIQTAERALAADTARVGIEVADLFPRVTMVGSIGLQAETLSGLGDSGAGTWGFGPRISWAALDLGRVRERIRASGARVEQSLAIYERTVLLALEETENSLVTLGRERERLAYLRESERAGAEAVDLARQRYRDGIADFLSVLDAERTLLSLQEQLVASETRTATSLIAVYKALAGGSAEWPANEPAEQGLQPRMDANSRE